MPFSVKQYFCEIVRFIDVGCETVRIDLRQRGSYFARYGPMGEIGVAVIMTSKPVVRETSAFVPPPAAAREHDIPFPDAQSLECCVRN